jgi:hypothetical protein
MRVWSVMLVLSTLAAVPAAAQSLYLDKGEHAVEGYAGWSTGPSSTGAEFLGSVGFGRVDAGLGIAHYTYTFDDGSTSSFTEYSPLVRYFAVKQAEKGAPISLSINGQFFFDDYGTSDKGSYGKFGTTVYRDVKVADGFSLQPYIGFAFVAESYTFGDGPAATAQYLTRDLGVHFTTAPKRPWILRLTLEEQAFRRETYRAARFSVIRRLP